MPTTRIKEKLSTLVSSQLPEFIQSDYTTFKAFLEAYYEFLEQDQNAQELLQNARSYNDIDRTVSSFVEYFLKQYCDDLPRDVLYNKKALVKNIQDLYNSKGSEKSYKLLFRILYNKDVELFYPSSQILRASDGKWIQKSSFFMRTIVGSGASIVGKNVFVTSSTTKYPLLVKSRKTSSNSQGTSTTIHEYFFDNSKNVPIGLGDVIEYEGFKGEIVGSPTSATITAPGTGFKVGDILPLTSGLGNSAKLKVTKVNATGGILNVQFINFGIGYTGDFYNFFSATLGQVSSTVFNYTGGSASITDKLGGFVERGSITTPSYAATTYFAEDYQGDILSEFYTSTVPSPTSNAPLGSVTASIGLSSDAAIYVRIGNKTKYPGYYENIDGFLSDNIYLEDQDFYQPFSYVVKVDERLSLYKKAVLDILHPAGTKLFGELSLNNSIDISSEILTTLRYLTQNLQDVLGDIDDSDSKLIEKPLAHSVAMIDSNSKLIIKPLVDSSEITEELYRLFGRPVSDSIDAPTDSDSKLVDKIIGGSGPYALNYFAEDYVESYSISPIYSIDYFLEDYVEPSDAVLIEDSVSKDLEIQVGIGPYVISLEDYFAEDYVYNEINNPSDTLIIHDEAVISVGSNVTVVSEILYSDYGTVGIPPYVESGYFAEDYAVIIEYSF